LFDVDIREFSNFQSTNLQQDDTADNFTFQSYYNTTAATCTIYNGRTFAMCNQLWTDKEFKSISLRCSPTIHVFSCHIHICVVQQDGKMQLPRTAHGPLDKSNSHRDFSLFNEKCHFFFSNFTSYFSQTERLAGRRTIRCYNRVGLKDLFRIIYHNELFFKKYLCLLYVQIKWKRRS